MRASATRFRVAAALAALLAFAPALAFATATITIFNVDGPGEGFNDPAIPVDPAPGNAGITVGQQRLIASSTPPTSGAPRSTPRSRSSSRPPSIPRLHRERATLGSPARPSSSRTSRRRDRGLWYTPRWRTSWPSRSPAAPGPRGAVQQPDRPARMSHGLGWSTASTTSSRATGSPGHRACCTSSRTGSASPLRQRGGRDLSSPAGRHLLRVHYDVSTGKI